MSDRQLRHDQMLRIGEQLKETREKFKEQSQEIVKETSKFAEDLAHAIGDISITEAKRGLVDFFADKVERMKL